MSSRAPSPAPSRTSSTAEDHNSDHSRGASDATVSPPRPQLRLPLPLPSPALAPPPLTSASSSRTQLGYGAPPFTPTPHSATFEDKGKGLAHPRLRSRSRVRVSVAGSGGGAGGGPPQTPRPFEGRDPDDDDEDGVVPELALEDDEVPRRDRGEELVRQRMKDRARIKKEAEKAKKRERDAARRASTSFQSHPDPYYSQPLEPRSRDPSRTGTIGGHSSTGMRDSFYSDTPSVAEERRDHQHAQNWSEGLSGAAARAKSPAPSSTAGGGGGGARPFQLKRAGSSYGPPGHVRRPSYASTAGGSVVEDVFGAEDREKAERERAGMSSATLMQMGGGEGGPGSVAGSVVSNGHEEESDGLDERDYEVEESDEDDAEDEDGEVEYTLKDRQDAINIEHPFGLPIWKPALYKKSRSVTRNAETALHATPSSTALRHLAPGNILWTLFFGIWLFLVCSVVGAVLWCVPWGGKKYGRVVWELGGYLFWPFGKYVEGWSDDADAEEEGDEPDESGFVIREEDEDEGDETESEAGTEDGRRRLGDEEDAGRTFGRGRSRLFMGGGSGEPSNTSALDLWGGEGLDVDHGGLPDEPPRRPTSVTSAGDTTPTKAPPTNPIGARSQPNFSIDSQQTLVNASSSSERARLNQSTPRNGYGTVGRDDKPLDSESHSSLRPHDFSKDGGPQRRVRALGRMMYWTVFYLIVAPSMLLVCILCWAMVFTIPMAKLLWVLLRHLNNEPLSLHFHSPPKFVTSPPPGTAIEGDESGHPAGAESTTATAAGVSGFQYPIRAGQRAPPVSRKTVRKAKARGRLFGPRSTVLLCTYRAAGTQYYKYTIDGVNILFINLLSLVFFVILDFFFLEPYVERHELGGFLGFIAGQGFIFVAALLSVIPLSYFIGMAVASISAQSSIGMGAVINASFGSIIEIILYCIALTQSKGELVEGSIVGSLLAGVLLMPGLSMIGGATRRKEQRFNARSAGVTSTMLIMAIIGILTPTLFYEIYGSFQLTCTGCDPSQGGTATACKTCYYEHVDPVDDPFYKSSVRLLSYWCAVILVLSYLIGLWFSLRTHASQIWQNAQPHHEQGLSRPLSTVVPSAAPERISLYKRLVPNQILKRPASSSTPLATPSLEPNQGLKPSDAAHIPGIELPQGLTVEDLSHVLHAVVANHPAPLAGSRLPSHARDISTTKLEEDAGHGGHDAPNWSRAKSATVLMSCTVLYAIIAEILVDVVDVVLDGSGIPEKFLGVTLFALVPNTTEFMNAISFAINGNIALSMEIGSAYALQVCLIQAPAMLAFSAYYGIGKEVLNHRSFTLVFPRWDVIAIMFSVFLLTYTYIEARANYYRGSILCLSYLVLLGGFAWAPKPSGPNDNPGSFAGLLANGMTASATPALSVGETLRALVLTLFTR